MSDRDTTDGDEASAWGVDSADGGQRGPRGGQGAESTARRPAPGRLAGTPPPAVAAIHGVLRRRRRGRESDDDDDDDDIDQYNPARWAPPPQSAARRRRSEFPRPKRVTVPRTAVVRRRPDDEVVPQNTPRPNEFGERPGQARLYDPLDDDDDDIFDSDAETTDGEATQGDRGPRGNLPAAPLPAVVQRNPNQRAPRVRNWMVTYWGAGPRNLPGHPEHGLPTPLPLRDNANGPVVPRQIRAIAGQYEQGERTQANADTGQDRVHWQGYIEFHMPQDAAAVLRIMGWRPEWCHLSPRRGTQEQCINYVTKDRTRVEGTPRTMYGTFAPPDAVHGFQATVNAARNGATMAQLFQDDRLAGSAVRFHGGLGKLIATLDKSPAWRDVTCYYYWGPTGTGKTRRVYQEFGHENVYTRAKPRAYGDLVWYDGYTGQDVLFLDEFRDTDISFSDLLRLTDGHPLTLRILGSTTHAKWTKVVFASNIPYDQMYKREDPVSRAALDRRVPASNRIYIGPAEPQQPPVPPPSREPSTAAGSLPTPRATPSPAPYHSESTDKGQIVQVPADLLHRLTEMNNLLLQQVQSLSRSTSLQP